MRYFLLIPFLFLIGCAVKETEYITKVEYEYVTYDIPKNLTTRCVPPKPIEIDKYNNLSPHERETYLTNYSITLLGDIKKCDNKIKSIVRYINEMNQSVLTKTSNSIKEKP